MSGARRVDGQADDQTAHTSADGNGLPRTAARPSQIRCGRVRATVDARSRIPNRKITSRLDDRDTAIPTCAASATK